MMGGVDRGGFKKYLKLQSMQSSLKARKLRTWRKDLKLWVPSFGLISGLGANEWMGD